MNDSFFKSRFARLLLGICVVVVLLVPSAAFAEGEVESDAPAESSSESTTTVSASTTEATSETSSPEPDAGLTSTTTEVLEVKIDEAPAPTIDTTENQLAADLSDETAVESEESDLVSGDSVPNNSTVDYEASDIGVPEGEEAADEIEIVESSEGDCYTAEIDKTIVYPDMADTGFTITFTETSTDTDLGSAQVIIPDGFTITSGPSIDIATSGSQSWSGSLEGQVISLWADSEGDYLGFSEWVSVTFSATTPSEQDFYAFETTAWTEANIGFDGVAGDPDKVNEMLDGYSDPEVWVVEESYLEEILETGGTDFAAWDNLTESWLNSNLKGYSVEDYVPHRFLIDAGDLDDTDVFRFEHDYVKGSAYGYVDAQNFYFVTSDGIYIPTSEVFTVTHGIEDDIYFVEFTVINQTAFDNYLTDGNLGAFYWEAQLSDTSYQWTGNIQSRVKHGKGQQTINFDSDDIIYQDPSILVTKEADKASVSEAGETITYTITLTNTGNVALTGVVVSDPMLADLAYVSGDTNGDEKLDLDEIWTYEGTYTVTQDHIDAGADIDNTATVNTNETGEVTADETVTITQTPMVSIEKVADQSSFSAPGTVTYTITLTNTGNVALTGVVVSDPMLTDLAYVSGDTNGDEKLDLDEIWTYEGTYTVTQDHIDAGADIDNTVTVNTNETGEVTADETVTITQTPLIELTKEATSVSYYDADLGVWVDRADVEYYAVGDMITYTFTVKNTGNVTLTNVMVDDPDADVSGDPLTSLAPGATDDATFTATYLVTQADLDDGNFSIYNVATVTGYDPDESLVTDIDDETVYASDDFLVLQSSSILVTKEANVDEYGAVGDKIVYTITVTNDGNVTLTLDHSDVIDDLVTLSYVSGDDGNGLLDVGESWIYTGTYTVVESDLVYGGSVYNKVTATAYFGYIPVEDSAEVTIYNDVLPPLGEEDPPVVENLVIPSGTPGTQPAAAQATLLLAPEAPQTTPGTGGTVMPILALSLMLIGSGAVIRKFKVK